MKNIKEIRAAVEAYNQKNLDSIRNAENELNRESRLFYALAANTYNDKDITFFIVASSAISAAQIATQFNQGSDKVVRWGGNDENSVKRALNGYIRASYTLEGVKYKEMEKDKLGTRATEAERKALEGLKALYPSDEYEFEHIGNHHAKGWRDIKITRKADGKRVAVIEVKGRNGRMI